MLPAFPGRLLTWICRGLSFVVRRNNIQNLRDDMTITRRTLLKLLGLFPLAGTTIVKALAKGDLKPKVASGVYLPPHFPKWDKVTDGLESPGKWALDFELSQLPADTVFPVGARCGRQFEIAKSPSGRAFLASDPLVASLQRCWEAQRNYRRVN